MTAGPRMSGCVAIRRIVTAQRRPALLTNSQMHPLGADLDALLTLSAFGVLNARNRFEMGTGNFGHVSFASFVFQYAVSAVSAHHEIGKSYDTSEGHALIRLRHLTNSLTLENEQTYTAPAQSHS